MVGIAKVEVGKGGVLFERRWPEEILAGGEIRLLWQGALEQRRRGRLVLAVDKRRKECINGSAGACRRGEEEEG